MKSKVIALALFVTTAATVIAYPVMQNNQTAGQVDNVINNPVEQRPAKIELVFALDTTGSMGGLIQAAKEKIWSIATTMASAEPAPEIKIGLVAYRDRGDQYVTKVIDLNTDLDTVYAQLMDFQAAGGGDAPESVNQALYDAVDAISWSQDQQTYKVVFLVGDAPPHMDYQDDVKYPQTLALAQSKGIVVNTIQCGRNGYTARNWQKIAKLGDGRFFEVEQSGGAVAITTPYDEKLASLSRQLDETRVFYGTAEDKQKFRLKSKATEKLHKKASPASRARRAEFNASKSGKANAYGKKDLVDQVIHGKKELTGIDQNQLPEAMQRMSVEQQSAFIQEKAEQRSQIEQEINALAKKRRAFLKNKVAEKGGAEESLDHQIWRTVRDQASAKGLKYKSEAPAY